jgi:predicted DNA-binding protein (MmcQ/YjbR family)
MTDLNSLNAANEDFINQYLLDKHLTTKEYPFGDHVAVFKVKGKMFATLAHGSTAKTYGTDAQRQYNWINLKCDPDEANALRDIFESVLPAYHMSKTLWNTIVLDGSIPQGELERMMDNSYLLVVKKMSKKDRNTILIDL